MGNIHQKYAKKHVLRNKYAIILVLQEIFHSTLNHHFSFILSGNNAVCYIKRKYYSLKIVLIRTNLPHTIFKLQV